MLFEKKEGDGELIRENCIIEKIRIVRRRIRIFA